PLGQLDRHRYPRLETVWGDAKYRNRELAAWLERSRARFRVAVVDRPEGSVGFVKLPKRWVSERTFAWRGAGGAAEQDDEAAAGVERGVASDQLHRPDGAAAGAG